MTPDGCRGSFHVRKERLWRGLDAGSGTKKTGRKNPTQHGYHTTLSRSSQRGNGFPKAKSVPCTKTNVFIWETFRLEKFENP